MPFNRLNHNILGEIRPRFRLVTSLEPAEVFEHLKEKMAEDDTVTGRVVKQYAILTVPPKDRHYWSPELQVRIEDDSEDFSEDKAEGTVIRCLIGPRQSVWLFFTFCYSLISFATIFGGLYGLSQLTMGNMSAFVWLLPVGVLLLPLVWLTAKIGQRTGRDQMLHLVSVLYHTLDAHGEVDRTT